jgi:hypothetical protein
MRLFYFLFFLLFSITGFAQTDSSIISPKSVTSVIKKKPYTKPITKDTLKINTVDSLKNPSLLQKVNDSLNTLKKDSPIVSIKDTTIYKLLKQFPMLNNIPPEKMLVSFKDSTAKDWLFYLLLTIVFLAGLIQVIFPRYFKNVFNIFLQTSVRQKQTREQLTQDNIAALLLNVLFIISSGTFLALASQKLNITKVSFWQVFIFATSGLLIIYLFKYFFTQFMGWVFNKLDVAQSYSFIIFIINKIIGVVLIPFLFLITFSTNNLSNLTFKVALVVIGFLFLFRFFSTYKNLGNRLKINAIHFFLYFCSIEILPLLIMYKTLNNYIGNGI